MRTYDYREAVCEDIRAYIKENGFESEEQLNDDLWIEDSVTGNASGSYTFSTWQAEENLCHNMDLLEEACGAFGCEPKIGEAEWCDVTIRCYVLGECISKVVSELLDEAESWWGELTLEEKECVADYDEEADDLLDACESWWDDLDKNEQINIYLENYE